MKKLLTFFVFVLAAITAWAQDATPVTLQDGTGGTKYVNMPKTGTSSLTLTDASVMYFKVYDDGGPYVDEDNKGYYSGGCNGYLLLKAPAGYKLQISGTIWSENGYDMLTIYDGETTEATQLVSNLANSDNAISIGEYFSSGQSLLLYFKSDGTSQREGLDLDVILCKPENANSITIESATGGVLHSDKSTALYGETVTLTWTHETGYVLESISVKDAYGRDISIVGGSWFNAATSFTMPVSAVTVTPKFIQATTSLDGLTVNLPKDGTKYCDIATGVKSFKVYDDGGPYIDDENQGKYSNNCRSYLVVTAPAGLRLQLTGTIEAETCDYLTVYDGTNNEAAVLLNQKSSKTNYETEDIGIITSTGESITIYFYSDGSNVGKGLDLEVTLFDPNEAYPVDIVNVTGGAVSSDKATAKFTETVTLTETHDAGYILKEISVVDVNGRNAEVTGGNWHNVVGTFTMPASKVTVTPTFIQAATIADGLYINMPKKGTITTNISTGVKSFKVYDNGGKDGQYEDYCDGYLVLNVPAGLRLQLTGTIAAETRDYLTVYDGTNSEAAVLLNQKSSKTNYETEDIGIITSTGETMTIYFYSDNSNVGKGLDLNVYVFNPDEPHAITIETAEGGVMTSDVTTAKYADIVTLTKTNQKGYALLSTTAKDANGTPIEVTGGTWYNDATSFPMSIADATVTPTFTTATTAEEGLFINMPKESVVTTNITNGIQSFYVYDDGGADEKYSGGCDGTLILTAPIGYMLKISGIINSESGYDKLTIWDGTEEDEANILLKEKSSSTSYQDEEIGEFSSTGRNMRLYFRSDGSGCGSGLNLKVTLIPITYTLAFDNGKAGATGTMDITGAMEDIELTYDDLKALPAVGFSRTAYDFTGWALAVDGEVKFADKAEVENLATEQGAKVTIYAKWKPIVYPITYDLAKGAMPEGKTNPAEYTVETPDFTIINPERVGYTFTGWTGTDLATKTITVTVTTGHWGERSYTATWEPNPYKVHFDINGGDGTETMADQQFFYDAEQALTANAFTRTGYLFDGWNSQADGKGTKYTDKQAVKNLTTVRDAIVTLYAQWKPITYYVAFNANNGTGTMANLLFTYDQAQALTENAFTRTGYIFKEWTTEANGDGQKFADKASVKNLSATQDATVTLYAQWTPITYDVVFNANNGTGTMANQTFTYDQAQALTENAFSRRGYTYEGWNSEADGTGTPYADKASVKNLSATQGDKVNIYAQWKVITYTLKYELAGGSLATANPATFTVESDAITLNNPTREGYDFAGWTGTGLSEATKTVTIAKGSIDNREYTATWTPIKYAITYDLAGGSVATPNPQEYTIETETFTLTNPTRKGYDFAGWTGTGLTEATKTVTITKGSKDARSYTATWTPIVYKITYDLAGGSVATPNPTTYTIETETFTLTKPTQDYYDFAGWTGTGLSAATETVTIAKGSTGDREYTATWEIKTKTINLAHEVSTFSFDYGLDFTGFDVKAYVASTYENGQVKMERVMTVPANTGVVLVGETDVTYIVPYTTTAEAPASNLLKAVTEDKTIPTTEGEFTNFLLTEKNDVLGFYKSSGNGTVAAGKAYLQLKTADLSSAVKSLAISFDDETAILAIDSEEREAVGVYDMAGRKVAESLDEKKLPRGVYVVNGKKVLIK